MPKLNNAKALKKAYETDLILVDQSQTPSLYILLGAAVNNA